MGMGTVAGGGSALLGSGAFTATQLDRDVNINVVSDSDALVRLGPCTNDAGKPYPNGQYVVEENGQFGLQVSDSNDAVDGEGVNPRSYYRFDNVFEICNQGSRSVCVDLQIPEIQTVPFNSLPGSDDVSAAFDEGIPSVIFYEGDDMSAVIDVDTLDVNRPEAFHLEPGDCVCVGFAVISYGSSLDANLIDGDLTIEAFANAECTGEPDREPQPEPSPQPSVGDATLEIFAPDPFRPMLEEQVGPPVRFIHKWTVNAVEFEALEEIAFDYEPFSPTFYLGNIGTDDLEVRIGGDIIEDYEILSSGADELTLGLDPTKTLDGESVEVEIARGPETGSAGRGDHPPKIELTGDGESLEPPEITVLGPGGAGY